MLKAIKTNKKGAFTLIEVILYIAIISIFTLVVASFWGSVSEIEERNAAMSAVNTEAAFILNTISRTVRTAEGINTPVVGSNSNSLSLSMSDVAVNPTVFSVMDGALYMQEAGNPAVLLTSNQVGINSINYLNVTNTGTAGAIRIQFELAYLNDSGKPVLDYTQTFYDTISIRK